MRHGHKKAIIAVARMLMTVIYHILQDKVCYDKDLYLHYNQLPTSKEITVEQAIALAKRHGYKLFYRFVCIILFFSLFRLFCHALFI